MRRYFNQRGSSRRPNIPNPNIPTRPTAIRPTLRSDPLCPSQSCDGSYNKYYISKGKGNKAVIH